MWGRVKISRTRDSADLISPFSTSFPEGDDVFSTLSLEKKELHEFPVPTVVDFEPYQVSVDLERFIKARQTFSTEEWMDLLLASAGYNPEWIRNMPHGHRLTRLYLMRLIPLVERNVNLLELGPKNTGKTHLLRNLSPYAFTVSGGQATPANLFVNLATGAPGLIQSRRVIIFDEVARLQFSHQKGTLSLLKDYMESGQFARGRASYGADTSLVFMGNLEVEGQRPSPRYRHLFQVLPRELQDAAVLDRLHGFVPGWEFPKLTPSALDISFALASDYFGEILLALRDWSYDEIWAKVQHRWPEQPYMTRRDVTAIDRIGLALFKLVFPDGNIDDEVTARELLALAAECRHRIHQQLVKMEPGEFLPYTVGFQGIEGRDDGSIRTETALDRQINTAPRSGESTGSVALLDAANGSTGTDVVVIQAVLTRSSLPRSFIVADPGLLGSDAVWHVSRFFLSANTHRLGLESSAQWDGMGVQFTGGPGDLRGRTELALVLAVVSAWLNKPLPAGMAAIGGLTLTGDVLIPPDLLALVMAAVNRGRQSILVPYGSPMDLLQDTFGHNFGRIEFIPVASALDALQWAFSHGETH
jgi:ATP-dependent Lon protease